MTDDEQMVLAEFSKNPLYYCILSMYCKPAGDINAIVIQDLGSELDK